GGTGRGGSRRSGTRCTGTRCTGTRCTGTRCTGTGCTRTGSDGGSYAGGGAGVGQGAVRDEGGAEPAQRVAHGRGGRVRAGGGQRRAPGRDAEDGEVDAVRSGRGPVAGPRPGRVVGQGLRGAAHVPTVATARAAGTVRTRGSRGGSRARTRTGRASRSRAGGRRSTGRCRRAS